MIARVAGRLIKNSKTRRFIVDHLPLREDSDLKSMESRLVEASAWADTQSESKDFHFSFTPAENCRRFDIREDCGINRSGRCVVTGIAASVAKASDFSLPHGERVDALKLLVHIVADAHQPLHTGFERDRGGNRIVITDPVASTLHKVWDGVLTNRFKLSVEAAQKDGSWYGIAGEIARELKGDPLASSAMSIPIFSASAVVEFASEIVSETALELTCPVAYKDEHDTYIPSNSALSDAYLNRATDAMLLQFKRAAVRLVQLLDLVADEFYRAERLREAVVEGLFKSSVQASVNRYNAFDDADLEDAVFYIEPVIVEEPEDASDDESEDNADVVAPEVVGKSMGTERLRNQKKAEKRAMKKRSIDGVDIQQIVLIKRESEFYLTYRTFVVNDSWTPSRFYPIAIHFADGPAPTLIRFDSTVFTNPRLSWDLLDAVFDKLRSRPASELPLEELERNGEVLTAFTADNRDWTVRPREGDLTHRWWTEDVLGKLMKDMHKDARPIAEISLTGAPKPSSLDIAKWKPHGIRSNAELSEVTLLKHRKDLLGFMTGGGKAIMVTTYTLVTSDLETNRFVFNIIHVDGGPAYLIDYRLLNTSPSLEALILIDSFTNNERAGRRANTFLSRDKPLVGMAAQMAAYATRGYNNMDKRELAEYVATFESVTQLDRPDSLLTLEFVLRESNRRKAVFRVVSKALEL